MPLDDLLYNNQGVKEVDNEQRCCRWPFVVNPRAQKTNCFANNFRGPSVMTAAQKSRRKSSRQKQLY